MRWQIGIRGLILLTAAIAVWFAHFQNRAEIARLVPRIDAMRGMARELTIADQGKVAVVKLSELWTDDERWEAYLPEGRYVLQLATRDIPEEGIVPPQQSIPISAGKRSIALEQKLKDETWRTTVLLDGKRVIEAEEPKEWDPGRGSTGGSRLSESQQFEGDKPVVLFRRRFMRPEANGQFSTPVSPCEGVLMWIERVRE